MSECAFGLCDGSGLRYDEPTNTAYPCECREQIIARNKAHSLSASIPKLYRQASLDQLSQVDPTVVTVARRFVERIDDHHDNGRGLWFMGPVGTGKTTLAMIVSKAALAAGRTVAIYSLPRLLSEIRRSFDTDGGHLDLLDRLTAVDLLHIDDVGAEQSTPWVLEELYSIVNSRYEDGKSMVVTTNIDDIEKLREQITEPTVSRLMEMCDELRVEGHDRRQGPVGPTPAATVR
jgi:DNA replication protein DnaC